MVKQTCPLCGTTCNEKMQDVIRFKDHSKRVVLVHRECYEKTLIRRCNRE